MNIKRAISALTLMGTLLAAVSGYAVEPPRTYTGKDGIVMSYVPEGSFKMGSDEPDIVLSAGPVHRVTTDAFYMDRYEITNRQYADFLNAAKPSEGPDGSRPKWVVLRSDLEETGKENWWPTEIIMVNGVYRAFEGYETLPAITVSWDGARVYCEWAAERLPTEAEWEKAARGGLEGKVYEWGNEIPTGGVIFDRSWKDNQRPAPTEPVGNYHPNGYGLYDMAGNVWEWCSDWYDQNYYKTSPSDNPKGPDSGNFKVLRGGSWYNNAYVLRVALRNSSTPTNQNDAVGFRCVKDAKQVIEEKYK